MFNLFKRSQARKRIHIIDECIELDIKEFDETGSPYRRRIFYGKDDTSYEFSYFGGFGDLDKARLSIDLIEDDGDDWSTICQYRYNDRYEEIVKGPWQKDIKDIFKRLKQRVAYYRNLNLLIKRIENGY